MIEDSRWPMSNMGIIRNNCWGFLLIIRMIFIINTLIVSWNFFRIIIKSEACLVSCWNAFKEALIVQLNLSLGKAIKCLNMSSLSFHKSFSDFRCHVWINKKLMIYKGRCNDCILPITFLMRITFISLRSLVLLFVFYFFSFWLRSFQSWRLLLR
jgi:hypothetical protein